MAPDAAVTSAGADRAAAEAFAARRCPRRPSVASGVVPMGALLDLFGAMLCDGGRNGRSDGDGIVNSDEDQLEDQCVAQATRP